MYDELTMVHLGNKNERKYVKTKMGQISVRYRCRNGVEIRQRISVKKIKAPRKLYAPVMLTSYSHTAWISNYSGPFHFSDIATYPLDMYHG